MVIARQDNEKRRGSFDEEAYRQRNVVERLINRLEQVRRVATRYEKRAVTTTTRRCSPSQPSSFGHEIENRP